MSPSILRLSQPYVHPRPADRPRRRGIVSRLLIRRVRDCWRIICALVLLYFYGIQWALQMTRENLRSHPRGRSASASDRTTTSHGDKVSTIENSLETWSAMWESYVEPTFETVYDLRGDSDDEEQEEEAGYSLSRMIYAVAKFLGVDGHDMDQATNERRRWEPEIPRFQAPLTLKLPRPIINVGFPKAGTSSIFSFFHCNGLKGQHWFCCEEQNHPAETKTKRLMSRCILENLISNHKNGYHRRIGDDSNDGRVPDRNNKNATGRPPKKQILEGCGEYDFYSEINGPRIFHDYRFRNLNDDGTLESGSQTKREPRLILPQHHYLEELHAQFPNATFILNTRPTQEWVQSVMRWEGTLRQEIPNEFWAQHHSSPGVFLTFADRERLESYGINTTSLQKSPPKKKSQLNATLSFLMEYHSQYIRDFVRRHPSHTLIQVDITRNETGRILADAFGLQESCWGHRNQNGLWNKGVRERLSQTKNRKILLRKELAKKKRQKHLHSRDGVDSRDDGGDGDNDRTFPKNFSSILGRDEKGPSSREEDERATIIKLHEMRDKRMKRIKGRVRNVEPRREISPQIRGKPLKNS